MGRQWQGRPGPMEPDEIVKLGWQRSVEVMADFPPPDTLGLADLRRDLSILSVVLSIEPGRSRHLGIAKAANRAIHLGFPASCRDSDPYLGAG